LFVYVEGSFASPTIIPTNGLNIVQISSGQTGTMVLTGTIGELFSDHQILVMFGFVGLEIKDN
jgi:hypothetical protein